MEQKILITLGVNPNREPCIIKGYAINLKNTKELRQDQLEWDLKISLKELVNFETFEKPALDEKQVSRFSVAQDEIVKKQL